MWRWVWRVHAENDGLPDAELVFRSLARPPNDNRMSAVAA